ncbi:MAG: DUF6049 family protein [Micrococcales bacterium]|nr:DUF6049 family protein [Micrococcales bacterium]
MASIRQAVLLALAASQLFGGMGAVGDAGQSSHAWKAGLTTAPAEEAPYQVEVTSANTELTDVSEFFVVSGTISNSTFLALEGEVAVRLATDPFANRNQFEAWSNLQPGQISPDSSFECRAEIITVEAHTSFDFIVECPVDQMNLGNLEGEPGWGPRGFVVTFATTSGVLATAPGYLTYAPLGKVLSQTRFTVAAGLVRAPGESWPQTANRLEQLVNQTNSTQVTWLVDPWVLAEEARLVDNLAARPLAGAVIAALNAGRPVYILPYADPDLNRLAHGDIPTAALVKRANEYGSELIPGLLGGASSVLVYTGVAWPNQSIDSETLDLASQSGAWALLSSSSPNTSQVTQAGHMIDLTAGQTALPALVSDTAMANTLMELDSQPLPPGYLLALFAYNAVVQQTQGQTSRTVVVLPRDVVATDQMGQAVEQIMQASWVQNTSLDLALETRSSGSLALASSNGPATGPANSTLSQLVNTADRIDAFATITEHPATFKQDMMVNLFDPVATACNDRAECNQMAVDAVNQANQRMDQVSVVTGSEINLISGEGKVPVLVTNQSNEAVVGLRVELHPQTAALRAGDGQIVDIPPGGQATVRIEIYAVANGSAQMMADLVAPNGQLVAPSTGFVIRVRAGWEDAFTAVAGCLVLLVLVLGLTRSIQRRRSGAKADQQGSPLSDEGAAA